MRWLSAIIGALLMLTVGIAVLQHKIISSSLSRTSPSPHRLAPHQGLSSLPLAAQGAVSATLGAKNPTYHVTASGDGFQAQSSAQRLRMRFEGTGIQIGSGKMQLGLSLRAMGYGTSLRTVDDAKLSANANRVTYRHADLSEWYINGPLGLEQGFTISKAPSKHPVGALTLSLALSGNAHASLTPGGQSISFSHPGSPSLRYRGLTATDAGGRALHSWLELHGGRLLLRLDTRGAHYPLQIDPLIQQGEKLTGSGEKNEGKFGYSVAISSDGNTVLIGGLYDNRGVGAVWVFTRTGSTWTQQGEKLIGSDEDGEAFFGSSVALSADGNTALIGGSEDDHGTGAAWVFIRSGSNWTQQGEKLTGGEEAGSGEFGSSVALSADGSTALVGARRDNSFLGAVWVFTRSGSTWTQEGEKLTGSDEAGDGVFGSSVALSADGDTALIGAVGDDGGVGAAWVFTRSGSTWSQQGEKLTGGGEVTKPPEEAPTPDNPEANFGFSVALSSDGNTALISAYRDNHGAGAVWMFTRSGSIWSQQGEKFVGGGENNEPLEEGSEPGGWFGSSVALSSGGNTALIGGFKDDRLLGAVWMFTRAGSTWSQQGKKITGSGASGQAWFGFSVAMSSTGNTALVGGPGDNNDIGAVWAFASEELLETVPTVTSITPNAGLQAGGTSVTITGTNLSEATGVKFGSTNATSFKVESETEITATSPAGTGTVGVTVTTPGGTSAASSADHFTYVPSGPAPTVKKISPAKGAAAGGTSVTITGTGFTGTTAVDFGSTSATSFTVNSATSITATSPAETTGTVDVTITTPNGTSAISTKDHFAFEAPTITSVGPNSGSKEGGTAVTVTGTGFGLGSTATTFKFSKGIAIEVDCTSTTTCTMLSPAAAKVETADVTATVDKKTSAKDPPADEFAYH